MTQNSNFKRRIRARASKTGESYSTARMHLVNEARDDQSRPARSIRLAVAQTTSRRNPRSTSEFQQSGQEMRTLMHFAHKAGAKIIHFPEGATCWPDKFILSQSGPSEVGPSDWSRFQWSALRHELEALRDLAKELGLWVVFGSVHQLTEPQRPHNSLYVVSDQGELVTRYDERLLSFTKISYMYTPGTVPITFEVDGIRFGCALGMESHFPEIFIEYEQLNVDCVLFSTTGGSAAYPNDSAFTAEVLGHAASNSYWVSYAVPARPDPAAISGIVTPRGEWAAQCARDGSPSMTVVDIDNHADDPSRPWRRTARSGLYEPHQVEDDPRSDTRTVF